MCGRPKHLGHLSCAVEPHSYAAVVMDEHCRKGTEFDKLYRSRSKLIWNIVARSRSVSSVIGRSFAKGTKTRFGSSKLLANLLARVSGLLALHSESICFPVQPKELWPRPLIQCPSSCPAEKRCRPGCDPLFTVMMALSPYPAMFASHPVRASYKIVAPQ